MSQPKRLEIIHLLRNQTLNVSQIQTMLDLPQANLSQHLMVLRKHHIVTTIKKGKEVYYSLSHPNIVQASDLMREVLVDTYTGHDLDQVINKNIKDLIPVVTDPVCHMRLSPKTAGASINHQHITYYFCASGCSQAFKQHPEHYL